MGKYDKLVFQILHGLSDANIAFDDLQHLLEHLGFEMRIRGSHHMFRKAGIAEKINIQRQGAKATPYQVKQVREVIQKYRLGSEE
ncbi:MAG: type II toxin-antitoxin system HicA family toxin [Thiobacillus sp.]|nr:type II toxin-antitoxin system HicA family toxin [Thiobacillus sp.]